MYSHPPKASYGVAPPRQTHLQHKQPETKPSTHKKEHTMLTLHLLEQSRALRILWLLEILGADYTLQTHPRDPQTLLAPEALKRIHPLGKSPLLQDGSLTLAEAARLPTT